MTESSSQLFSLRAILYSQSKHFDYSGKFERMKSMKLKIVTLNCFDSPLSLNRGERIYSLIKRVISSRPDIVCFQEITFSRTAQNLEKLLGKNGYRISLNTGSVFNKGGLFIASLFPIIESQFYRFKNQGPFNSLQVTDRILGKGFQKVTLLVNNNKVTLFNVHLAAVYISKSESEKMTLEDQCNQLACSIIKDVGEIIVCGDFNFPPSNPLYSELLTLTKLIDASKDDGPITVSKNNTNRQGLYKNGSDVKLDYTFVSYGLSKNISSRVIFDDLYEIKGKRVHLSDHFGLQTQLNI